MSDYAEWSEKEIKQLQSENAALRQQLDQAETENERVREANLDLIVRYTAMKESKEQAEARAEMRREALYDCAVALKDAGSLSKEMHDLIVKANESGGDAWLLRKEADDVDSSVEWLHVNYHHLDGHHLGILTARANRLRQQASEIESGDNNE